LGVAERQQLGWLSWQALNACVFQEVVSVRQLVTVWRDVPETLAEFAQRGLTPETMVKVLELLHLDSRLSLDELTTLETALGSGAHEERTCT
jgi:hypothetical protein